MQTCILYANYTFFKSFFEGKCKKYHRIQTKVKILNKKKNYFEFHEPGKYTRQYEYPYQIESLIFIIILTRRHLTCTCHALWPNGGIQRWEIQLHVYNLQIETMKRFSMRTAKMLLHTITFQLFFTTFSVFFVILCSLFSCGDQEKRNSLENLLTAFPSF